MRKIIFLFILIFFSNLIFCNISFAKKKRIAVLAFDDGAIKRWWGGKPWHPGQGIADMIITELVKSKKFDVIEREKIQQILEEQGFSLSGMVDPTSAVSVGKILGADLFITGKVTQFDISTKKIKAGGIKLGKLGGIGVSTSIANCAINARIIEVETGKILSAAEGKATKDKTGFDIQSVDWAELSFNSSDFEETILGQATKDAVQQVVNKILSDTVTIIEGKIITSSDKEAKINLGTSDIQIDQILIVIRKGEELTDPDTGEVLGAEEEEIGEIKVIEVLEKYSKAKIIKSTKPFQRGDTVRLKK